MGLNESETHTHVHTNQGTLKSYTSNIQVVVSVLSLVKVMVFERSLTVNIGVGYRLKESEVRTRHKLLIIGD